MPATAFEKPKLQINPKSDWVRILIVDDDDDFLIRVKENFELNNFTTVDTASSPEDAVVLLNTNKGKYNAIIADIDFETSEINGDEFVVKNRHLFGKARILVITGIQENQYELLKQFKDLEIPIQDKTEDGWREDILEVIDVIKKSKIADIEKKLEGIATISSGSATSKAELGVKELFLDWLVNLSKPEEKIFLMGDDALSAFDLVDEIESETEMGNSLLSMFIREIRYSLKLNKGKENVS